MASFTTAQKREVIQRHYPTANNIAVKGNVFFAVFPDAEPVIGWLHSPRGTLWVKAAVPVSACPALRTVPPRCARSPRAGSLKRPDPTCGAMSERSGTSTRS